MITTPPSSPTVYLVRHGESESNVHFKIAVECLLGLCSPRLYSASSFIAFISAIWHLTVRYNPDSCLSELGHRQAASVKEFFEEYRDLLGADVVYAHSALRRAQQTARTACGDDVKYIVLECLNEANQTEHIFPHLLRDRIKRLETWVAGLDRSSVVVAVGHAQYFKHMLGRDDHMQNCDVWRLKPTFSMSGDTTVDWGTPEVIFRSPLAYSHPLNRLKALLFSTRHVPDNTPPSDMDGAEDEPMCRICQMTQSESPESRLIRPCRCTGSLSYVHLKCLNEWRATSSTASYQCFVCKYSYRIERTALTEFLMSETAARAISVIIVLAMLCLAGSACLFIAVPVWGLDICREFCTLVHWRLWWRSCTFQRLPYNYTPVRLLRDYMYVDIEQIRERLLCNYGTFLVIEISMSGCIVIGTVSIILYMINAMIKFVRSNEARDARELALLTAWAASLTQTHIGRLGIWVGMAVASREVYSNVIVYGRKIAQAIGENILEPNQ
mmetsp:Transcript_9923/g.14944  ORF Transcript_9923/g.14944 Transcript_9923/m.14944 type:complete len:498 (+) Transcript_9923:32-1525(+)